jgi:hypothetical protein
MPIPYFRPYKSLAVNTFTCTKTLDDMGYWQLKKEELKELLSGFTVDEVTADKHEI